MAAAAQTGANAIFAQTGDLLSDFAPMYAIPIGIAAVGMLLYLVVRALRG